MLNPVSQEATSHSSTAPVDSGKDHRVFQVKAADPPKKEHHGSVFLGILVVISAVLFGIATLALFLTRLAMVRFEIFFL